MSHAEPEHNRPPEGTEPDEPFPMIGEKYDDMLPVSLHRDKLGQWHLLDRHNDEVATFDPAIEKEDMDRIVAGVNNHDEVRVMTNQCVQLREELVAAGSYCGLLLKQMDEQIAAMKKECADVMDRHEQQLAQQIAVEREKAQETARAWFSRNIDKERNELRQQLLQAQDILKACEPFAEAWAATDLLDRIREALVKR